MGKILKTIIVIITIGVTITIDEHLFFPAILQLPFFLNWLGVVVVSGLELLGLIKEVDLLFK